MKIAIVEDIEKVANQTKTYLEKYSEENGMDFDIEIFLSGFDFLDKFDSSYDLLFLDIKMPNFNGMEAAKDIRKIDVDVGIIFMTNLSQYAIMGYEVSALDYFVKPIEYKEFQTKLKRALQKLERAEKVEKEYLFLNLGTEKRKISIDDILYVESVGHKIIYHLAKENISAWKTMAEAEKELPEYRFKKCNRSFCVNLSQVEGIKGEQVRVGNDLLKISRSKHDEFLDALTMYLSGRPE